jgi:hypothetical protein
MDDKTIDELREYYDTHDVTEGTTDADWELIPADSSDVLVSTSIRLPKPLIDQVRERAEQAGMPTTALMRQWIIERLQTPEAEAVVSAAALTRFIAEHAVAAKV